MDDLDPVDLLFFTSDLCGESVIFLEEGEEHNISSPNYPDKYPNDLSCAWQVKAVKGSLYQDPSARSHYLVATILAFNTESGYDPVILSGSEVLWEDPYSPSEGGRLRLSGNVKLTTVTSRGGLFNVTFTSDAIVGKSGFQINFKVNSSGEWHRSGLVWSGPVRSGLVWSGLG